MPSPENNCNPLKLLNDAACAMCHLTPGMERAAELVILCDIMRGQAPSSDPQEWMSRSGGYLGMFHVEQFQAAKLVLLSAILKGEVIDCSPQALMDRAACYMWCFAGVLYDAAELVILCAIKDGNSSLDTSPSGLLSETECILQCIPPGGFAAAKLEVLCSGAATPSQQGIQDEDGEFILNEEGDSILQD